MAREVRTGAPVGDAALRRACADRRALRATVTGSADGFDHSLAPVISTLRADGDTTLRALAGELNARGVRTRRGGRWLVSNLRNLLARFESL